MLLACVKMLFLGKLLYAAEQKQDENILMHIRDRDCVQ